MVSAVLRGQIHLVVSVVDVDDAGDVGLGFGAVAFRGPVRL